MLPFKEGREVELAVEHKICGFIQQHLPMEDDLKTVIFQFFHNVLQVELSTWENYLKGLEDYLYEQQGDDFITAVKTLIKVQPIVEKYLDPHQDEFVQSNRWGMYFEFKKWIRYLILRTIVLSQNFSNVNVQIKIFPEFSQQFLELSIFGLHPYYPDALMAIWINILFELQCSEQHSDVLQQLILTHLPKSVSNSRFFFTNLGEQEVYAKRLDILSLPVHEYRAANLPLELITSKRRFIDHQQMKTVVVADVPAVWSYCILQSLEKMNSEIRTIWLEILHHAGAMPTQINDAWLTQAQLLTNKLPVGVFNKGLNEWLKVIVAEVPRKTAPFSVTNKPYVLGLLGFASLGDAKYLDKTLFKYQKFFCSRSVSVADMTAYALNHLRAMS